MKRPHSLSLRYQGERLRHMLIQFFPLKNKKKTKRYVPGVIKNIMVKLILEVFIMAVAHKGAISFGLVHIPVNLYTTTQNTRISFNQLHKVCKSRIKYKKTCPNCQVDVKNEDIVKGFEYEKDRYVIMEDEDFEKIKTEKDKSISILLFTDLDKIDPLFFEKTYYVIPNGSDKAYNLLKSSLEQGRKVAIGKTVLGTKETLVAIRPTSKGLLIETMLFAEEIKDVPKDIGQIEADDGELQMAKVLIDNMTKEFNPEDYKDEYSERLKDAISQKVNGMEVVESKEEDKSNVIDLMEALKRSVEATRKVQ